MSSMLLSCLLMLMLALGPAITNPDMSGHDLLNVTICTLCNQA